MYSQTRLLPFGAALPVVDVDLVVAVVLLFEAALPAGADLVRVTMSITPRAE